MRIPLTSILILLAMALAARADKVVLVAGGAGPEGKPAHESKLTAPFGIDFDKDGNSYLVELSGGRVLKIDKAGLLTRVAGTGEKGDGGDGGDPLKASFNGMHSLAVAPNGDVFIADTWNNRVRKLDAKTGKLSAFAGSGEKGFEGDGGAAAKAKFGGIYCVALDPKAENLYMADLDNRRIRKVELKSGIVTTVAGNGKRGVPADGGAAGSEPLVDPRAVAVDAQGQVYVLERGGHALRVVGADGKIRTVAGTGKAGYSGDGGAALKAELNGPKHLCIDRNGSVLIADTENHVIRRYLPKDGKMAAVAGTGKKGTGGVGGPSDKVELTQPHGVSIHPSGSLYIVDSNNHRVLRIEK